MDTVGEIVALDAARRTGIADGLPGATPKLSFIDLHRSETDDNADVFCRAFKWIARRFDVSLPFAVVLERPVPQYSSTLQDGIRGVFMGYARAFNVKVVEVGVNEWRKYFIGVGNLPGPIAKQEAVRVCRTLQWDVPTRSKTDLSYDDNAAEAGGIWLYACAQLAPLQTVRHEPLFTGRPNVQRQRRRSKPPPPLFAKRRR